MKKLGFGLMRLPLAGDGKNFENIDIERFKNMADSFIRNGFTYFDTAYTYHGGNSERAFREAVVNRYPRDAYTITSKLPMFIIKSAEELPKIFNEQLERLGVDYFDYYWLHSLSCPSYETVKKTRAFQFISKMKKKGKIKHIGFSFHDTPALLDRILTEHPEAEFVQLQYNYLDLNDPAICAEECYNVAASHGKPVIVMEPVKGGALADIPEEAEKLLRAYNPDLSPAGWAIRFAASKENVLTVLSGMSDERQLEENMSFMRDFKPMNAEETEILSQAAEIIRNSTAIPCTSCRYCVDGCPKKIDIPDYFAVYNNLERFGEGQRIVAETYYENLNATHGKASDCIACRRCENVCPQHLKITDYLKVVAAALEHADKN